MKYIYTIYEVNYKRNIYEPFAIAQTKKQGLWRVRIYNEHINKSEETFFQLVRICVENGGYFNEGKIIAEE